MSANIKYTDESLGDVKVVPDFLPRPEEIIFKNDRVEVQRGFTHGRKSQENRARWT
ncbi:MAG: hypothetical protein KF682_11840 [Nitrospira sp.]|nr:hypothetical protein [Nitrospira sp.]